MPTQPSWPRSIVALCTPRKQRADVCRRYAPDRGACGTSPAPVTTLLYGFSVGQPISTVSPALRLPYPHGPSRRPCRGPFRWRTRQRASETADQSRAAGEDVLVTRPSKQKCTASLQRCERRCRRSARIPAHQRARMMIRCRRWELVLAQQLAGSSISTSSAAPDLSIMSVLFHFEHHDVGRLTGQQNVLTGPEASGRREPTQQNRAVHLQRR